MMSETLAVIALILGAALAMAAVYVAGFDKGVRWRTAKQRRAHPDAYIVWRVVGEHVEKDISFHDITDGDRREGFQSVPLYTRSSL